MFRSTLWLVLPTIAIVVCAVTLCMLLRAGMNVYPAIAISLAPAVMASFRARKALGPNGMNLMGPESEVTNVETR
jgi:hypothetical protein